MLPVRRTAIEGSRIYGERRPRVLVIGMGNPYRGDDGVGLRVAQMVKGQAPAWVCVREEPGDPLASLEMWQGDGAVILIDAVVSGATAGTVHRVDAFKEPLGFASPPRSTHSLGLAQAIELGRTLGCLPEAFLIYGIEGKDFKQGAGLSAEVEAAAPVVVENVLRDIGEIAGGQVQTAGG